jgi:putative membrane protein
LNPEDLWPEDRLSELSKPESERSGCRSCSLGMKSCMQDRIPREGETAHTCYRYLHVSMSFGKISGMIEDKETNSEERHGIDSPLLAARSAIGGLLMGLANLVPGISGGTMLLAAGIYPDFVKSIAEVTTLRFRLRSILVLGCVVATAALAILLLAGTINNLVINQRWIMYSLFIGLTLGGVPIVWRMLGRPSRGMWIGLAAGFLVMGVLAFMQMAQFSSQSGRAGYVILFLSGIAGSSAMILPGVSGAYLLLLLGQYVPILSAIDKFKEALEAGDMGTAINVSLSVGLPVGLGVVLGIVCVSNLMRMLLDRYRKPTLGVLLGLLLGAVIGLWPFQQGVRPEVGDAIKGQVLTEKMLERLEPADYPTQYFKPAGIQAGGAVLLLLAGFGITTAISRLGKE